MFEPTIKRNPADTLNPLYSFGPKRVPGPGTKNWSLFPRFSLPGESIGGPGVIYGKGNGGLNILPGYPQHIFNQAQVVDGVNGVVFGGGGTGITQQGLVDMEKLVKAQAA